MKVNVQISLITDGDYSLRNHLDLEMPSDGVDGYYNSLLFTDENPKKHKFEDDGDMQFNCIWRATRWLEKVLCEVHVSYTHHYVLDDIFHMFDDAMKALGKREPTLVEISGNYENTFIQINIWDK